MPTYRETDLEEAKRLLGEAMDHINGCDECHDLPRRRITEALSLLEKVGEAMEECHASNLRLQERIWEWEKHYAAVVASRDHMEQDMEFYKKIYRESPSVCSACGLPFVEHWCPEALVEPPAEEPHPLAHLRWIECPQCKRRWQTCRERPYCDDCGYVWPPAEEPVECWCGSKPDRPHMHSGPDEEPEKEGE